MKKLISVMLTLTVAFSAMMSFAAFPDINGNTASWAGEAIDALQANGIINGYEDGSFRPDSNVTRAEFEKMLCLAFDCTSEAVSYTDTNGHWAEKYISDSADFIYTPTNGYYPEANATRAEIAYALALAAKPGISDKGGLDSFSDKATIPPEISGEVAAAVNAGFITGYEDSTIRGDKDVTRAEAATLIFRAMNYSKVSVPPSDDEEAPGDNTADGDDKSDNGKPGADDTQTKPQPTAPADPDGPKAEIYDELLEKGHIYTLYPQKHLLLVSSSTMLYDENGDESYKLRYYIADTGDEFESALPGDTAVAGLKSSMAQIKSGDVLVLDTGFWGQIGCLYVLAELNEEPATGADFKISRPKSEDWSEYPGNGTYEITGGKLESAQANSKSYTLTVSASGKTEELTVPRSASADIYTPDARRTKWENDDLSAIADSENTYILVRYTDGKVTEVVAVVH